MAGGCGGVSRGVGAIGGRGRSRELEGRTMLVCDRRVTVAVVAAVTVVLGVGNQVRCKLARSPPLNSILSFSRNSLLSVLLLRYFSVLYLRYRAGIVTDEMLSMPKAPFLAVGLLEALGAATGMAAGAILSGASIPVLSRVSHFPDTAMFVYVNFLSKHIVV